MIKEIKCQDAFFSIIVKLNPKILKFVFEIIFYKNLSIASEISFMQRYMDIVTHNNIPYYTGFQELIELVVFIFRLQIYL
jgi:hypothetical protein